MLITIEGIDGCGKTTAANIVREYLAKRLGVAALITSELNHTNLGQTIKGLINLSVDRCTELELIMAARSHHIHTVLAPELDSGSWVIMDRYIHSTLAYQGGGRMFETAQLVTAHMALDKLPIPDLVIYLDITPETARDRMKSRGKVAGMDNLGESFYNRARGVYLKTIKKYFSRDALALTNESATPEQLRAGLEKNLDRWLKSKNDRRAVNDAR